jgi:alpha-D-xyloside xylohydrolase
VTVTHFAGEDRSPDFPLADTGSGLPQISETDDELTFTSGALTARLAKAGAWSLDFRADGRRLTGSGTKAMAVVDTEAGEHYIREQLDLGVDHFVYGLGERFGPLVKNGQSVDSWNADGGTASEQAYKAVGDTVVVTLG